MSWKFTDKTNQVVMRTNPDGSTESVRVEVIQDWIAQGNVPEPFDGVPFSKQREEFLTEVRATREQILNRLAGIGAAAVVSGDTATQQAFVTARQGLLDLTSDPGVLAATDLPGLKLAVLLAYRSIVSSMPDSIVNAFNLVDE
jgi:hypothetical protein